MPLYPAPQYRLSSIDINPLSPEMLGNSLPGLNGDSVAAAAWPAANVVIYTPFLVVAPAIVTKLWWMNGAVAGNADAGVYDAAGTLLVSCGSTVVAGANVLQVADVADTALARGLYYFGMVVDTVTTLTINRLPPAAEIAQALGCLEQAGVTLPLSSGASPATFAKMTRAYIPFAGVQLTRTIGPG